ncbi:MAG: acyl-CoA thioesterase [Planctomycetes bacterium]|nr:acyl-CoA thioesterase [Planctomycetota bacterium]
MFVHRLTIQLADTDAYSILFFPNQLRFCQVVFQAWLASVGLPLPIDRARAEFLCVVVRAEADYEAPINVGDELTCAYSAARVGATSFTNAIRFTNQRGEPVGQARVVYVVIDPRTSAKMTIPPRLRSGLEAIAG